MTTHAIYVTANDLEKLRELLYEAQHSAYRNSPYLHMLSGELSRAAIITEGSVPADVITMHSQVALLDIDANEEMVYTLVFPDEADVLQGKISVLAPIGTAMLGYRVGDEFEWDTPGGQVKIRVEKILYQPEAAGHEPTVPESDQPAVEGGSA